MSKVWVLTLVVVMLAGAAGLAEEGECIVGSPREPQGVRIPVNADPPWFDIDGSQPSYVIHGFGGDASCGSEAINAEALCASVRDHLRFELRVNGALIEPTFINSFETPRGASESTACPLVPGETVWRALWVYEFPAGYFAPGIYFFEGTWRIVDYPIACLSCPEESVAEWEEEGGWIIGDSTVSYDPMGQQTLTLTVLYPP